MGYQVTRQKHKQSETLCAAPMTSSHINITPNAFYAKVMILMSVRMRVRLPCSGFLGSTKVVSKTCRARCFVRMGRARTSLKRLIVYVCGRVYHYLIAISIYTLFVGLTRINHGHIRTKATYGIKHACRQSHDFDACAVASASASF